MSEAVSVPAGTSARISLSALFRIFLTIGGISFGGGVVAYLREYVVRAEGWMDDDEFLDALEVSQTLPGLNAVNMSVIVGDKLRGGLGAVVAVLGIMLPGTILILSLGIVYMENRHSMVVNRFLLGVAAAAVGLLLAVTLQLGHRQLEHVKDLLILVATCLTVSWLHWSLLTVLCVVGGAAILLYHPTIHRRPPSKPGRFRHVPLIGRS